LVCYLCLYSHTYIVLHTHVNAGRAIRHRACALKDMAHALISAELDEDFEKQCLDILESRKNRGMSALKHTFEYSLINVLYFFIFI